MVRVLARLLVAFLVLMTARMSFGRIEASDLVQTANGGDLILVTR